MEIVRFFQPLVEANMDVKVTYTKWGLTKLLRKGKEVTHMMPRSYEESPTAVVVELSSELQTLCNQLATESSVTSIEISSARLNMRRTILV